MKREPEDYKRSNHNDFATSSELEVRQFSGVRQNKVADRLELWLVGEIVATMDITLTRQNPGKWEEILTRYLG